MELEGRKVLVVGVGPGLGSAATYFLAEEGAEVLISARNEDKLKEISSKLSKARRIGYVAGDASSQRGAEEVIAKAAEALGSIDDLVLIVGNYITTPIEELKEEDMNLMLGVNLNAPLYLTKAALPHLKNGSSIVMVSSIEGTTGTGPKNVAYAASKAGLAKAIEILAHELIPKGIRVNGVAPKSMRQDFEPGRNWREERKLGDATCPPEDVANVILMLLSKRAEWINGAVIPVDGGSRLRRS